MQKLFCRRINSMKDVNFIVFGIKNGIKNKVYSDLTLMETLRLISGKDVTFYIFLSSYSIHDKDVLVPVGFGAIRNKNEVYKLFVTPQVRGQGFGTRISLWLKQQILNNGHVPVCWIKKANDKWNKTMGKQGMIEVSGWFETKKYMLKDFKTFVEAVEKHKIAEIVYVKEKLKIVIPKRARSSIHLMG